MDIFTIVIVGLTVYLFLDMFNNARNKVKEPEVRKERVEELWETICEHTTVVNDKLRDMQEEIIALRKELEKNADEKV